MTKQFDADVIVAGAGPAGAAAAIHLCNGGARVLLLDWQSFPRDKVCGDFLSAVSLSELTALDVAPAVRSQANIMEALNALRHVPDSTAKRFILDMVMYVVSRDR